MSARKMMAPVFWTGQENCADCGIHVIRDHIDARNVCETLELCRAIQNKDMDCSYTM
jgi:hypothetical protein